MSLEAILSRVKAVERRRVWQWIGYIVGFWVGMWGIFWMVTLLHLAEKGSLEEQGEVVEAFAEIYPIEL
jgi:hypothetical protein